MYMGEVDKDEMKLTLKDNTTTYNNLHTHIQHYRSETLSLIVLSAGPKGIGHLIEVEIWT